jgi:lipoprotein NlpD
VKTALQPSATTAVVVSLIVLSACYYPPITSRPQPVREDAVRSEPAPDVIEPTPRRVQEGIYHTVGRGETLWRICKTYGVSMQEVAELNAITDAAQIKTGDRIFIPGARQARAVDLSDTGWQKPPEPIQQSKGIFIWPVQGKLVAHYGVKKGMKYDGIDIQAPMGTAVRAADAGTVVFVNVLPGYGNIIIIKHRDSYSTVYAHNQMNLAREGSRVSQGAVIARLGNSHNPASSPTLHFQIRRYNKARNPLFYLQDAPSP